MKKIISLILSLAIVIGTLPMIVMAEDTATTGWDGTTTTAITAGTGTAADPYLISTPEELAWARDMVNTETDGSTAYPYRKWCFKLTADIDLNNKEWIPMGLVANNGYSGTFDGNGFAVKNIRMTVKRTYMGFFGHIESSAVIKNLGIENMDVDITGGGASIGGLYGRGYATAITNCYVKNSSILNNSTAQTAGSENNLTNTGGTIGGFIGTLRTTTPITNCYVYNVEIGAPCRVSLGGFFGAAENDGDKSVITNCYVAKLTEKTIEERQTGRIYSFGKKKNAGTSTTTVNSWTEFIGRAGTRADASYPYEPEFALANEGATKRGIVAALVDNGDGTFVVDPEINDGYPCFAYERNFAPATEFAGGSGTTTDPYIIASAAQLALVAEKVNGGGVWTSAHYKLDRDIDFGNMEWTPIGNGTYTFGGTFDGDGHVIRNLYISELTTKYVGLFGSVLGGTIENVGIENMTVALKTQTDAWQSVSVGGMVGYLYGTVRNSYIKNSSIKMVHMGSGYGNVGSFVGSLRRPATIENCYTYNVAIHGDRRSSQGGFLGTGGGNSSAASITNCYTNAYLDCEGVYQTGYLEAPFYAFAKDQEVYTTFTDCYSTLTDEPGDTDTATGYNYNEANSAGTLGASKKTITDALVVSGGSYKIDPEINDGFPSLKFEEAQQVENYVMAAIMPGAKVKVTLVEKSANENATMYIAAYDSDGRVLSADSAEIGDTLTFTTNVSSKGADHIKVFVWDNNLTAISKMYKGIVDFDTMIHVLPLEDGVTEEDIPSYGRKTRLVLMGDSLMDSVLNTAPGTVQGRKWGWEAYIENYLNDNITAVKHGHSGYTIEHFMNGQSSYHYCSWTDIKDQFGKDDYVVIALGTNDNSRINNYINGVTTDASGNPVERYSAEQFKTWYKEIIADVKAKGANIILLTPPPANGNVSNGKFYAATSHSRTALLELANEADVEVIDITQLYVDALNALIDNKTYTAEEMCITKSGSTITASGTIFVDAVHFTEFGADLLAKVVAKAIADSSETGLEDFVVLGE